MSEEADEQLGAEDQAVLAPLAGIDETAPGERPARYAEVLERLNGLLEEDQA